LPRKILVCRKNALVGERAWRQRRRRSRSLGHRPSLRSICTRDTSDKGQTGGPAHRQATVLARAIPANQGTRCCDLGHLSPRSRSSNRASRRHSRRIPANSETRHSIRLLGRRIYRTTRCLQMAVCRSGREGIAGRARRQIRGRAGAVRGRSRLTATITGLLRGGDRAPRPFCRAQRRCAASRRPGDAAAFATTSQSRLPRLNQACPNRGKARESLGSCREPQRTWAMTTRGRSGEGHARGEIADRRPFTVHADDRPKPRSHACRRPPRQGRRICRLRAR
jgi:hypothetical protein